MHGVPLMKNCVLSALSIKNLVPEIEMVGIDSTRVTSDTMLQ